MCIFLVQKMHSIKIPQCVFFSCKKCTRLKFAAKVLHFFQIHKKNHKIFYIFSNRVENIVIKARFGNHGIVESRRESGLSDCPAMEEKYCGDTITAKWTYVMNQNTISGNGRRWDVGIIFRRNRQSYAD